MTRLDDTLDQLNAARADLTKRIIVMSAQPGTPQWNKMMLLAHDRDQIVVQINTIIAMQFNEAGKGLDDQVAKLTDQTDKLVALQKTLDKIDDVLSIADTLVQVATTIITIAAAA